MTWSGSRCPQLRSLRRPRSHCRPPGGDAGFVPLDLAVPGAARRSVAAGYIAERERSLPELGEPHALRNGARRFASEMCIRDSHILDGERRDDGVVLLQHAGGDDERFGVHQAGGDAAGHDVQVAVEEGDALELSFVVEVDELELLTAILGGQRAVLEIVVAVFGIACLLYTSCTQPRLNGSSVSGPCHLSSRSISGCMR